MNAEIKACESFINLCDELEIAEEGVVGAVLTGIILSPAIILGTMLAISSICDGIRNIKEIAKGTHKSAKMYREYIGKQGDRFKEGLDKIEKYIKANSQFEIPVDIYNQIMEKKASDLKLLSTLSPAISVLAKCGKPNMKDYAFMAKDDKRDEKLISDFKSKSDAVEKFKKDFKSKYQGLTKISFKKTSKEKKILSSEELLKLVMPDSKALDTYLKMMELSSDWYPGDGDDWWEAYEKSLALYYDLCNDDWYPIKAPLVAYYQYAMNVSMIADMVLDNYGTYMKNGLQILTVTKPVKK